MPTVEIPLFVVVLAVVGVVFELMSALQHAVRDDAIGEWTAEKLQFDAEILVLLLFDMDSNVSGDDRRIENDAVLLIIQQPIGTPASRRTDASVARVLDVVGDRRRCRMRVQSGDVGEIR